MAGNLRTIVDHDNSYMLKVNSDGSINVSTLSGTELAVNQPGVVSFLTTDLLDADANITSDWFDSLDYGTFTVGIHTDQASATNGLKVEFSHNASDVAQDDQFTISADKGKIFSFTSAHRYFRVNYTNGAVAQTHFELEVIQRKYSIKPSSHRIQDSIVAEDDAELVKAVLTADANGSGFVNLTATASNNLRVANVEDGLSIAKGDVTGTTFIHKFGSAPDFDTTDGDVDIWDGANDGGHNAMQYTYSTTADIDSLSSSNAGDTVDIEVQGLDANYDLVLQTITLTGQTRAALTTNLIRVFRLKNVGSTDLVGNVYCYVDTAITAGVPDDNTKTRAIINNGNNQTLMAIYTVPNGKTGYMRSFFIAEAGANKSTNYVFDVYARPFGQVFQLKHKTALNDSGTTYLQHRYSDPEKFTEKTDIAIRCHLTAGGTSAASVAAGFDLVIADN